MNSFIKIFLRITLTALILIVVSCSHNKNEFKVSGVFENTNNEKIFLYKLTLKDRVCLDSARFNAKGKFELKGSTESPAYMMLELEPGNAITILAKKKDHIKLGGDIKNFSTLYYVENSYESQLLKKISSLLDEYENKGITLFSAYSDSISVAAPKEKEALLKRRYITINNHVDEETARAKEFISQHPESFAGLLCLYYYVGNKRRLIDPQKDFYYYRLVDSVMSIKYPDSDPVIQLNRDVAQMKKTMLLPSPGKMAANLSLPDINGKQISLSSLHGKYVLVYFWASWCDACRMFNKQLKDIYSKHKNKFTIYQVGIEKNSSSWKNAIEEDNMKWIQVSDLQFWNSEAVNIYKISDVPVNFLLDPEGKIIETNIEAEELDKILSDE